MKRYAYSIYKPNPDEDGDPYLYVITVYSRNEAKILCTPENGWVASVTLEELHIEYDNLGRYERWVALTSGSPWIDELRSNEPIDNFLYPVST